MSETSVRNENLENGIWHYCFPRRVLASPYACVSADSEINRMGQYGYVKVDVD